MNEGEWEEGSRDGGKKRGQDKYGRKQETHAIPQKAEKVVQQENKGGVKREERNPKGECIKARALMS